MTQTFPRPALTLSLTPMQLHSEVASSGLSLKASKLDEPKSDDLLLRPGLIGEMFVMLENIGNYSTTWKLVVNGDFPAHWCNWKQDNFEEIAPHASSGNTLSFLVDSNFFESQQALRDNEYVQINYQVQISVYTLMDGALTLVQERTFNLLIRPISSYQEFLPTLYQENDFFGRFLSIIEQAFDPAVQTIENLWAYLDPLTAPSSMLSFLAQWVGWDIDKRIELDIQRRLIRNAITLYRWHGTEFGLRFYLHLYTGLALEQIQIREIVNQGFMIGTTNIGFDSMVGGGQPYHFRVELYPDSNNQIDEVMVREIIKHQKPAFCTYDLEIVLP